MRTRRGAATGMALGLAAIGAGTGASRGAQAPDTRPVPVHPNLHYWQPVQGTPHSERMTVDICVYGGTSAGVVAAIAAARHSKSVVLVAPEQHLGCLTTQAGLTVTAREFIDATYEGDLLAKAGGKYTGGREANSVYHETVDGVQVRDKLLFL